MRRTTFAGACVVSFVMALIMGCKADPRRRGEGTNASGSSATGMPKPAAEVSTREPSHSGRPSERKAVISKESPREIGKRLKASGEEKVPPGTRIAQQRKGCVSANGLLQCLEIALSFLF